MSTYTKVSNTEEDIYTDDDEEEEEEDEDELFSAPQATIIRPLMSPRKRTKVPEHTYGRKGYHLHREAVIKAVIYLVLLILLLIGMAFLSLQLINVLMKDHLSSSYHDNIDDKMEDQIIGCSHFEVEEIWTHTLHQMLTESAFRLNDVNKDGTPDVVMGFATGADRYFAEPILCDLYFNGSHPCLGGLLALDGKSGQEIWRHYTEHEVFALNCNVDIDSDGVRDCLGGGRAGVFHAVSGASGELLWKFDDHESKVKISNVYTPQFIRDMNSDGVQDVLVMHGGDPLRQPGSQVEKTARLIVFSGFTGEILQWVLVPDKQESYYSPQVYYDKNNKEIVLFGTGGEAHGGSLWVISLQDLYQGHINKAKELYRDNFKGVMTPPVLVDLTDDGVKDIVMAMYNSTVVAIDGDTYTYIWNFTMPSSESYSTPAPGYYNDDMVPDFMVKYAHGPGYPIYYYSQATIIDGKSGKALLEPYIKDTIGSQNSPITVSLEGHGNDIYLYWVSDCHQGQSQDQFTFVKDTNVHEQSRSDLCKLRFNSKSFTKLYMMNQHSKEPGTVVYNSDSRWEVEHRDVVNTSALALKYVHTHPEFRKTYSKHLEKQEKQSKKGDIKQKKMKTLPKMNTIETQEHSPDKMKSGREHEIIQETSQTNNKNWEGINTDSIFNNIQNGYRLHNMEDSLDNMEDTLDNMEDTPNNVPTKSYQQTFTSGGYIPSTNWAWKNQRPVPVGNRDKEGLPYPGYKDQEGLPYPGYRSQMGIPYQGNRGQPGIPYPGYQRFSTQVPYDSSQWYEHTDYSQDFLNNLLTDKPGRDYNYGYEPMQNQRNGWNNVGKRGKRSAEGKERSLKEEKLPESDLMDLLDSVMTQDYYFDKNQFGKDNDVKGDDFYVIQKREKYDIQFRNAANKVSNVFVKELEPDKLTRPDSTHHQAKLNLVGAFSDVPVPLKQETKLPRKKRDSENQITGINSDSVGVLSSGHQVKMDLKGDGPYVNLKSVKEKIRKRNTMRKNENRGKKRKKKLPEMKVRLKKSDKNAQRLESKFSRTEADFGTRKEDSGKRLKRHVGPHDGGGVQRLLSTGTLAPVLDTTGTNTDHSIDIIFATYWFYPAKTQVILPQEQKCIDDLMANETQRFEPDNRFYGFDHDAYKDMVMDKCVQDRDDDDREIYESQSNYNPFNIHMGQTTVYRMRLKCTCQDDTRVGNTDKHCSHILPFSQQQWAAYMGTYGNSHFDLKDKH